MQDLVKRKLIFVSGKGGVGKTAVSKAIALALSRGKAGQATPPRVLWTTFEDPTRPPGELRQAAPGLWHLNNDAGLAFEEYATLKIGVPLLAQMFLKNKLIRYLSQAAPGIHELVLLGKVWFERTRYDHVVIDMPSTGYGVAMFQSVVNFSRLFKGGGPLQRDALAMLETLGDPAQTGQLIVSIPEETPLRESLELRDLLIGLFPSSPPALLLNKRFPYDPTGEGPGLAPLPESPDEWPTPFAAGAVDYIRKRARVERHNLRIWSDVAYRELRYLPPAPTPEEMTGRIAEELLARGLA